MRRGSIVDYTFPSSMDVADPDGITRAKPALASRPAVVLEVYPDGTVDLHPLCETWESCAIVRRVKLGKASTDDQRSHVQVKQEAKSTGLTDAVARAEAVASGCLDGAADSIKGTYAVYVKAP